jgi:ATP-binding cassette subfamily B protein
MLRLLKQLTWFFKEQKRRYTIAFTLLLITGAIELVPALLIGDAVDAFQHGTLTVSSAAGLIVMMLAVIISSYIMNYVWMHRLFGGAFVLERTMRSKFMQHLFRMDLPFFEKYTTGDLLARGTNDMKTISRTAGFGILTLIDSVVFMALILGAMIVLVDWRLTLAAVLPLPVIAIIVSVLGDMIHTRFSKAQAAFGDLNNHVLESVAGMRVIRAFRSERKDEALFEKKSSEVYKRYVQVARVESFFDPVVNIVVGLSYVIGIGYGAYLVFNQQLTIGQIITFNLYLGMLIWPMFAVGELVNIMQQGRASYNRVLETLMTKKAVVEPENAAMLQTHDPIRFENVSFSYPKASGLQLNEVTFSVGQGETIGIVGKTGSGKSTLVKQLLKYYPPGSGRIIFGGKLLTELTQSEVRRWIGYVPQDDVLFSRSVRENVTFAAPNADEQEIVRAIEVAAFDQDLAFLPEGLETSVGENGVSLSGGQKQRISIARALVADSSVLILDDSLSAVDAKTEAKIIKNIQKERAGKTTFITTHRMSAIEHADLILVMENGGISECGTHAELMKHKGWYRSQVENQSLGVNI